MMRYVLYFLLFTTIFLSCKKENERETSCFNGIVEWRGSPAADGLGWTISNDDSVSPKTFIPRNLDDDFKVDGLKVSVCLYETDEKASCFCVQPPNKYHITSIRRR